VVAVVLVELVRPLEENTGVDWRRGLLLGVAVVLVELSLLLEESIGVGWRRGPLLVGLR
jgi:hypothetical protein